MNVFFYHLPKCGGTYVMHYFKTILKYDVYRFYSREDIDEIVGFVDDDNAINLHNLQNVSYIKNNTLSEPCVDLIPLINRQRTMVVAHKFNEVKHHFLFNKNWLKMTGFRCPFARFFSLYSQMQRGDILHEFDEPRIIEGLYQFITFYQEWKTSINDYEILPANIGRIYQTALRYLDYFDIIYDYKSLKQCLESFGKPVDDVRINISDQQSVLQIKYDHVQKAQQFFDLEYQFYQTAVEQNKNRSPVIAA